MNAQGEDVVAGVRTPHPMDDLKKMTLQFMKNLWDMQIN